MPLKRREWFSFSLRDTLVTLLLLLGASLLCFLLQIENATDSYAFMVFLLAVFLISRFTYGYFYGTCSAFISVLATNFFFTYPYRNFNFTLPGYPLTVLCMLAVAMIMGAVTSRVKQAEQTRLDVEKERTRGNLLRAVSHDLRTPLTSILGASSAIIENDGVLSREERLKLLSEVKEDAEWLIRMVENLLTVTRMDVSASVKLHKEPEAVEELLADTLQKFGKRFPDWAVRVTIPGELLLVPMDAMLIEQVLINLLENGVLHAKGATLLAVSVHLGPGQAVFEVMDNGAGIPPERLETLFQGVSSRDEMEPGDQHRNMGIGLSVCAAIIQAHHGTLTARNNPAGGATFQFTLPLEVSP